MKSNIENITHKLLVTYKLLFTPVDVENLAHKLKLLINRQDLDDNVSGFFVKKESENIIGLNQNHPEVRQRFTISHEIGHFKLHSNIPLFVDSYKGSIFRKEDDENSNQKMETEANYFAASLLMPKVLIEKELSELSENYDYEKKLKILSKSFNVSKQAMDYRMKTLGFYDYGF